jgi:hypothetical protein
MATMLKEIAAVVIGVGWTRRTLRAYITDPQAKVKGNRMPYGGVSAAKDVDDIVAYLKTLQIGAARPAGRRGPGAGSAGPGNEPDWAVRPSGGKTLGDRVDTPPTPYMTR